MNKRITLSDREIECIVSGLKHFQEETTMSYQVIKVGRMFIQDIINKLSPELLEKEENV